MTKYVAVHFPNIDITKIGELLSKDNGLCSVLFKNMIVEDIPEKYVTDYV